MDISMYIFTSLNLNCHITSFDFWKLSRLGRLKICAKIIFSVPVSSAAGIERLFSEAGMLLTKQRKRMSPKVMKKLV